MIVSGKVEPNPDESYPGAHPAIFTSHLTKQFGTTRVLNDINLNVPWNNCLAVFGHNGAGKSTLLRILATLAKPSSGTVNISGHDLNRHTKMIRQMTGFLGHQLYLYRNLTVRENLQFFGRLYSLTDVSNHVEKVIRLMSLQNYVDAQVRTLSNGTQKRVALARTILHEPALLILDEPESGLDLAGQEALQKLIGSAVTGGATVIVATHNRKDTLDFATGILLLEQGRVALHKPTADLQADEIEQMLHPSGLHGGKL